MSQKHKTTRTALLAPILLTSVMSIFGVGIGTFCWYEYQSHANATYNGTAVNGDGKIDIGLISPRQLNGFAAKHHLSEDTSSLPGKFIYWTYEGESFDSNAILDYADKLGYASNRISATSSSKYQDGDVFHVYGAPTYMADSEFSYARASTYTHIALAFKTTTKSGITLKSSDVNCENSLKEAVRIHFQQGNDASSGFIYNPSSLEDGQDAVGGILNLNQASDRFYDFDPSQGKEHIYGQCASVTYDGSRYQAEEPIDEKDINCFVSNHMQGLYVPTITPEYANYHGNSSVIGSKILTVCEPNRIGQLETDIYVEGWDKACVEQNISGKYNLKLEFTYKEIA